MNSPLVSIQIPTFNQKQYIREAAKSACEQSYKSIEVLVVDDCSSYDVKSHLADLGCSSNLNVIVNENNLGRVGNYRNTLFNHVKGKYFINLDGDDYFVDFQFIDYAVGVMESFEENNPVVFEYNHDIDKIKKIVGEFIVVDEDTILVDGLLYFENLHLINEFNHASCIFNTAVAKSINFYSTNSLCCDFESASRILLEGSIIVSRKKVAQWRIHDHNSSWSLEIEQYYIEKRSITNIIAAANGKVEIKKIVKLEEALSFGLYLKMISSFLQNKPYKGQISFLLINMKLKLSYYRAILSYIKHQFLFKKKYLRKFSKLY